MHEFRERLLSIQNNKPIGAGRGLCIDSAKFKACVEAYNVLRSRNYDDAVARDQPTGDKTFKRIEKYVVILVHLNQVFGRSQFAPENIGTGVHHFAAN